MNPRIFLSPPHLGGDELPLVQEAFASNYIAPLGPMVDAFEREFTDHTGIPHCLALASGTAAMHLALRELGVGRDDLVLASTLTFIGSVNSATYLGANLAFLDAHPDTWNLDPALLAEELTDRARTGAPLPKAVIPTDLYGQCCDLDELHRICAPYGIPIISDAAEAMGARYLVAQAAPPADIGQSGPPVPSQPSPVATGSTPVPNPPRSADIPVGPLRVDSRPFVLLSVKVLFTGANFQAAKVMSCSVLARRAASSAVITRRPCSVT